MRHVVARLPTESGVCAATLGEAFSRLSSWIFELGALGAASQRWLRALNETGMTRA